MSTGGDIGFGLGTAFGYGTADFLAKTTTDRVGFLSTLLYLELFGTVLLFGLASFLEPHAGLPTGPLLLLIGISLVNVVGSYYLYRAFEFGTLSIVSPLVSGYPALIVLLAVVFLREPLTASSSLGIGLTLVGSVLVARVSAAPTSRAKNHRVGIGSAMISFVAFAVFYFGLKFVVGPIPPITTAAISRLVALVPVAGLAGVRRLLRSPRKDIWWRIGVITILDSLAFVSYNVGVVQTHALAVLGTVSGLFSAVTVAWAVVLLRERLNRTQWSGVASIFGGIVALSLGPV